MKNFKWLAVLLAIVLGFVLIPGIAGASVHEPADLDEAMNAIVEDYGVAGITAAVVKQRKIIWQGSYGWHDIEADRAMQDDSIIRVASISKSFTALAAMQLVQKGLLDLDEDINYYLSGRLDSLEVEIRNPNHPEDIITVRQLLNHTSSIRNGRYVAFNTAGQSAGWDLETDIPTLDDYFDPDGDFYAAANWATFAPGAEFEYSNMGFVVLGAIIESISGQRFDIYMNEKVLHPLGMVNSSFNYNDLDPDLVAPMYRRISDAPAFTKIVLGANPTYDGYEPGTHGGLLGPQGSLLSTSEDLTKFMVAMMNSDQRILSRKLIDEMHTLSVTTAKGGAATFWGIYEQKGLGIHITDKFVDGVKMYGHTGGAYGIITDMYYMREKNLGNNLGIVFLINGCNEDIFGDRSSYYKIEEDLADLLYDYVSNQKGIKPFKVLTRNP